MENRLGIFQELLFLVFCCSRVHARAFFGRQELPLGVFKVPWAASAPKAWSWLGFEIQADP